MPHTTPVTTPEQDERPRQLTPQLLSAAEQQQLLQPGQAAALWQFVCQQAPTPSSRFTIAQVLYTLGGLLAIGAMTVFMQQSWSRFGPLTYSALSAALLLIALLLAEVLHRRRYPLPAALCATVVMLTAPLILLGLQMHWGWWDDPHTRLPLFYLDYPGMADRRWLSLEVLGLLTGLAMVWRYRAPLLMLPLSLLLWVTLLHNALDLLSWWHSGWRRQCLLSLLIGVSMLGIAGWLDHRYRRQPDYAHWWYVSALTISWTSLTLLDSHSELGRFIYCLLNLGLMLLGPLLNRRVFTLYGTLGVFAYFGYLAWSLFADSTLFPFILCAAGLLVIGLGVKWQQHEVAIANWVRRRLHLDA
ncbi:DUF2157 domain-containing protein [Plesiomonas shigelloides]|uniref:DUF2157 domain-containing protein n=1 Tax=Plesiomonas shigelloides TaxID=703 RepID=UPI003260D207